MFTSSQREIKISGLSVMVPLYLGRTVKIPEIVMSVCKITQQICNSSWKLDLLLTEYYVTFKANKTNSVDYFLGRKCVYIIVSVWAHSYTKWGK